ncbi:MAG: hypothetical protein PG977_000020 [Bartonella clarridgeiae]|nr:MAG: hypothetical protein PG977_000020 [Bartonella clarridgeiae]
MGDFEISFCKNKGRGIFVDTYCVCYNYLIGFKYYKSDHMFEAVYQ